MKRLYTVIGAVLFWLWIAGSVDLIDVYLCIGPVGKCNSAPKMQARIV